MRPEAEWVKPSEIEKRSFEIIGRELEQMGIVLPEETAPVVLRCIHTSADFDYAKNLVFTGDVIPKALETLRSGAVIITDTRMAQAGINKKSLQKLGGRTCCFMSDEDVALQGSADGRSRRRGLLHLRGRKCADCPAAPCGTDSGGASETGSGYCGTRRFCQCCPGKGTDPQPGCSLYCRPRKERREQYCGVYLQCASVYGCRKRMNLRSAAVPGRAAA